MDEGIEKAFRRGEANVEIIELAKNWCAHLNVEIAGGTGLIEAQTGLPIGMRCFTCEHASASGFSGVALEVIALDFYDRNCVGCQKRVPVRLPNLSQLVAKREEVASTRRQSLETAKRNEEASCQKRHIRRQALRAQADEPTQAIFESIDSFDREPSAQEAAVLVELTTAIPERFGTEVCTAIFELAEETASATVAETALTMLRNLKQNGKKLCDTALRVLPRFPLQVAGTIVAENVSEEHRADIESAGPALISLAGWNVRYVPHYERAEHPEGFLAAFRVAPDAMSRIIREMLCSSEKHKRIHAVQAIQLARTIDSRFGIHLIAPLVESTRLPDNKYDLGSSASWVLDLLGEMLEAQFDDVDEPLAAVFARLADHDEDVGLYKVYLRLFRSHRREKRHTGTSRVHENLFERLLVPLSTPCEEQGSLDLLHFLRDDAKEHPGLVERHIDSLLGVMAILAEETVGTSILHLPPNPLAALEAESRKRSLHYLVDAIANLVGTIASQRPATVGKALLSTLTGMEEGHDALRAALIKAIGLLAHNREQVPSILPILYGALTGASQVVRAAGARAYGELIECDPDDLPPLLHESFITLLGDSYVIVHSAALRVLDRRCLPTGYDAVLVQSVFYIIQAHSGGERNNDVLKVALDVFLTLHRRKRQILSVKTQEFVLRKISLLRWYDSEELLRRHARALNQSSDFTLAVLRVIQDEEVSEHTVDELMTVLSEVPVKHVRAAADEFVAAMQAVSSNGHYVVDSSIEILTSAGLWSHALELSKLEERCWNDTEWDRERKLHSQLRTLGCEMELYSSTGDIGKLRECVRGFREKQKEVSQDEQKHRNRRDPLFGWAGENQSA